MGFFSRKNNSPPPPSPDALSSLATALSAALGNVVQQQAAVSANYGAFLDKIGDIAGKRAAQVLGSRGGKKRASRAAESKDCELCRNPMSTNITPAIISKHREHQRAAAAIAPKNREELN